MRRACSLPITPALGSRQRRGYAERLALTTSPRISLASRLNEIKARYGPASLVIQAINAATDTLGAAVARTEARMDRLLRPRQAVRLQRAGRVSLRDVAHAEDVSEVSLHGGSQRSAVRCIRRRTPTGRPRLFRCRERFCPIEGSVPREGIEAVSACSRRVGLELART
jgi:hypothetical protein